MKKVLVADDKAPGRELLRAVLEQSGHAVYEASDGIEALRGARELLHLDFAALIGANNAAPRAQLIVVLGWEF